MHFDLHIQNTDNLKCARACLLPLRRCFYITSSSGTFVGLDSINNPMFSSERIYRLLIMPSLMTDL